MTYIYVFYASTNEHFNLLAFTHSQKNVVNNQTQQVLKSGRGEQKNRSISITFCRKYHKYFKS